MTMGTTNTIRKREVSVSREAERRNTCARLKAFTKRRNHSPRRLLNEVLSIPSRALHCARPLNYPMSLIIEPTTACQLKCPLCPVGLGTLKRATQHMRFETFRKVVDDVGDYIYSISLNGAGEPLLNQRIIQMIQYAKRKGIFIDVYTNLQARDEDFLRALVRSGLDRFLISMEGTSKDVYESYRVNGSFERITDNICLLVQEKKRSQSTVSIDLQFVVMKENEHQVEEVVPFAEALGVDNLFLKPAFLFQEGHNIEKVQKFIPQNERLTMYKKDGQELHWKGARRKACPELWVSSTILVDGSVAPCCFDYDGTVILGNVRKTSFRKIWRSQNYRRFRRKVTQDADSVGLCASIEGGCPSLFFRPQNWLIHIR